MVKDERLPEGSQEGDDDPIDSLEYPGLIEDIKDTFDCNDKTAKELKSRFNETMRKIRDAL